MSLTISKNFVIITSAKIYFYIETDYLSRIMLPDIQETLNSIYSLLFLRCISIRVEKYKREIF